MGITFSLRLVPFFNVSKIKISTMLSKKPLNIKTKKGDICPVCEQRIKKPNFWVRYHIAYQPNMCILACRYCNYTEYAIRTSKVDRIRCATPARVYRVLNYHRRYNIIL